MLEVIEVAPFLATKLPSEAALALRHAWAGLIVVRISIAIAMIQRYDVFIKFVKNDTSIFAGILDQP